MLPTPDADAQFIRSNVVIVIQISVTLGYFLALLIILDGIRFGVSVRINL